MGVGGRGIQHSKVVHTDVGSMIGSCNFTTSSRGNVETGLLVQLFPEAAAEFEQTLDVAIAAGVPLADVESMVTPPRGKSRDRQSPEPDD